MLSLKLLGALSLRCGNISLPPEAHQKRRLALLAIVGVGDAHGVSRERLQSYLWPDSTETRSRHALDQLIYTTRRSLGADPILSDGGELRLDPNVIDTDLRQFRSAIDSDCLEKAVEIHSGPLLEGFHLGNSSDLETWLDTERSRTRTQYEAALRSLAKHAESENSLNTAAKWWLKLGLSDPLSSRVACDTIRCLMAAGDNAAAIRHARNYQSLVRQQLDVEPDPSVEDLIARLPKANPSLNRERPRFNQDLSLQSAAATAASDTTAAAAQSGRQKNRLVQRGIFGGAVTAGTLVIAALLVRMQTDFTPDRPAVETRVSPVAVNPAANAYYLRGVNAWNDRSKSALDTAVVYFRKAIEREPGFANAHAGLANAYVMIGYSGYRSAAPMFSRAKAAAIEAIKLDSTAAAPYAALGMELTWERKFTEAEAAYKKALTLDPSYATAHQWHGILRMILGDTPGAVAETRRAAELDPLSLQIQNNYATFLSASGKQEEALKYYQKVVGDEPDTAWVRRNPWLLTNMASAYAADGQFGKALEFGQRAMQILPGHPRAASALANVYYRMGRPVDARRALAAADSTNEHYPAYMAFSYAAENNADSAFAWFDRVNEWGIPILISLPGLRKNPVMENDPRLKALFARLGLP